jgi:hypothetical protein
MDSDIIMLRIMSDSRQINYIPRDLITAPFAEVTPINKDIAPKPPHKLIYTNIDDKNSLVDEVYHCTICLDNENPDIVIRTKCNHIFHKKCLEAWIESIETNDKICPLCMITI